MKILTFSILITCLYSNAVLAEESTCYGTTSKGRLEKGVELPSSGDNFVA
jgi:penicillin-insensitive murein endopeptidase